MRDQQFIAEHRGGPLKKEQHYQLIQWACRCAEHVLPLFGEKIDERLENALQVAKKWREGKVSVGDARKASVDAHAVATAHMADHSLGAAGYALKAVKSAGKSVETERKWQDEQLTEEIKDLVLSARQADRFKKI
jgi:hypothetical protein